jgi:hypothetical protein
MRSSCHCLRWRPARCLPRHGHPVAIQSRADVMSAKFIFGRSPCATARRLVPGFMGPTGQQAISTARRRSARDPARRISASMTAGYVPDIAVGVLAPGWSIAPPGRSTGVVGCGRVISSEVHRGTLAPRHCTVAGAPPCPANTIRWKARTCPRRVTNLRGVARITATHRRPLLASNRPGAPWAANREPGMRHPGGPDTGPAARILRRGARSGRLMHIEQIAGRAGEGVPWPKWAPAEITAAFTGAGVGQPWAHQAAMAEHAPGQQRVDHRDARRLKVASACRQLTAVKGGGGAHRPRPGPARTRCAPRHWATGGVRRRRDERHALAIAGKRATATYSPPRHIMCAACTPVVSSSALHSWWTLREPQGFGSVACYGSCTRWSPRRRVIADEDGSGFHRRPGAACVRIISGGQLSPAQTGDALTIGTRDRGPLTFGPGTAVDGCTARAAPGPPVWRPLAAAAGGPVAQ